MSFRPRSRSAFTILELLIVVLIIAILVSLLVGAGMKAMTKMTEVETRTEIAELDGCLAMFMREYNLNEPPPSWLLIREDGQYDPIKPLERATLLWLKKWLGRDFNTTTPTDWNGNQSIDPPYVLEGQQLLVLWTGGIPNYSNGIISMTGFNANNAAPTANTTPFRKGPYMGFKSDRLILLPSCPNFPVYIDAYKKRGTPMPYAFFSTQGMFNGYNFLTSSIGGDCVSIKALPWYEGINAYNVTMFTNINRWQILSAGRDGVFGSDINPPAASAVFWNPLSGDMSSTTPPTTPAAPTPQSPPFGWDDQSNFTSTVLGVGQH